MDEGIPEASERQELPGWGMPSVVLSEIVTYTAVYVVSGDWENVFMRLDR